MTRRVDGDHHRAPDALRVPPAVDHGRAGARALADQVDAAIPERPPDGFEVVDTLRQRVAGKVEAIRAETSRAGPVGVGLGAERLRPEHVRGVLQHRDDLGTVEPRGSVDAAVADEDDIVRACEPARLREIHVGDARPALEAEDRRARVRRASTDALHRQCDQAGLRVAPVLGHDQGAAVGSIAAAFGAVGARLQDQFAGVCP